VEYLVYCRDRAGIGDLRWKLVEEHWSFMDEYADVMIARGPTLADDLETPTGSLHIVDLADAAAVRRFAFEEPNYRAGVYDEVLIRRFVNESGRTMWEYPAGPAGRRFLIIAHGSRVELRTGSELIVWGPLYTEDGAERVGMAILAQFPDEEAVREAVTADRLEIHNWRFGGRQ
jgi:uncharacterized protein YciI